MSTCFEILAYQNRTVDFSISLYESDGATGIALATADVVRVKIGRGDGAPSLDLASGSPTANGSTITIDSRLAPSAATLHLAQADLADLTIGPNEIEIIIVDTGETAPENALKRAQMGVLQVIGTMGGEAGLP